jgi:hypothetical protein
MKRPYGTGRFAEVGDMGSVTTIADVAEVVRRMLEDLIAHPDEWENPTLERFLDALGASLDGIPQGYANQGKQFPEDPTWEILAAVLVMASAMSNYLCNGDAAAPLPVLRHCASCAPGRLAIGIRGYSRSLAEP